MCVTLDKIRGKSSDDILKRFYGKDTIPIDIVTIANNIGIKLFSVDYTQVEENDVFKEKIKEKGCILGDVQVSGDDVSISYSSVLPQSEVYDNLTDIQKTSRLINRQRFTIAHEIAHCCLGHMSNKDGRHIEFRTEQLSYKDPKEFSANIFAGALLMPASYIQNIAKILGYKLPLQLLSKLFRVSKTVAKARLEYLIEIGELPDHTVMMDT